MFLNEAACSDARSNTTGKVDSSSPGFPPGGRVGLAGGKGVASTPTAKAACPFNERAENHQQHNDDLKGRSTPPPLAVAFS